MKTAILSLSFVLVFLASCYQSRQTSEDGVISIDLIEGMNGLTDLKLSDFGNSIRFVPLETTDSCLIGLNPRITLLKDGILVTTDKQCLLFDKQTGKFRNSIGHIGQDPKGYSGTSCWVNEDSGLLYFLRKPDQLIKYDLNGNMVGKAILPEGISKPSYFHISDSLIVGYYGNLMEVSPRMMASFDETGAVKDTIPFATVSGKSYNMGDIQTFSIVKSVDTFGNVAVQGVIYIDYTDGKKSVTAPGDRILWECDGGIRFRKSFTDTIFAVRDNHLEPYLVFQTGDLRASDGGLFDDKDANIHVSYTNENERSLFFQFLLKNKVYTGLYDKTSKQTKLAVAENLLTNDLIPGLPLYLSTLCSYGKEYGFLMQASEMQNCVEEHPDLKNEQKLSFLKGLNEDANPVVVIVDL